MTRDILRPLEGQLVTFTGRLASVTRQGDAHAHLVCARAVRAQ